MKISEHNVSNPQLADELLSVNSIYPDPPALSLLHSSPTETTLILAHPVTPITFILTLPTAYPDVPPTVNRTHSIGDRPRGEGTAAVDVLRETVGKVWHEGEVCLFDLLGEAGPLLEPGDSGTDDDNDVEASNESVASQDQDKHTSTAITTLKHITASDQTLLSSSSTSLPDPQPVWTLSVPVTSKKSSFLAHAAYTTSKSHALHCISHLLSTNKKLATATHNITAYRIRSSPESSSLAVVQQDYDDDGETAAGGRVLHLMQMMDVWDVVVVVSRWYGGVRLGPDRFRIINSVVREALIAGGFTRGGKEKGKDYEVSGDMKGKGEDRRKAKK